MEACVAEAIAVVVDSPVVAEAAEAATAATAATAALVDGN